MSEFSPTPQERAEEETIKSNREAIVDSLSRIKYQSLRHLVVNTGLSADAVTYHVDGNDEEIRFQMVGVMAVYFLIENQPDGKLYNSGNNSFLIRKENKNMKNEITVRDKMKPEILEELAFQGFSNHKAAEKLGVNPGSFTGTLSTHSALKAAWRKGKERRAEVIKVEMNGDCSGQAKETETPKEKPVFTDFEKVVMASAENDLAKKASDPLNHTFADHRPDAYEGLPQKLGKHIVDFETVNEKFELNEEFQKEAALDEKLSAEDAETDRLIEQLDAQIKDKMNTCAYCEAPLSGLSIAFTFDDKYLPFCNGSCINSYELINGQSKESIEAAKQNFLESLPKLEIPREEIIAGVRVPFEENFPREFYMEENDAVVKPDHFKTVALSNGRTMFVGSDVNIFEASKSEREFVNKLADLIQEYEEQNNAK